MSVCLRPYEKSDWPEVLALWIEAWTRVRADIDFAARAPWLAELFARSENEGAEIVVAQDKRGLAGFVLFSAERRWLEQIAVHPRGQGGGVARKLIRRVKAACPDRLELSVNADNARALAFYHSEGFFRAGRDVNPLSGLPTWRLRWEPEVRAAAAAPPFKPPPAPPRPH
jgi:putative acetyltransferase